VSKVLNRFKEATAWGSMSGWPLSNDRDTADAFGTSLPCHLLGVLESLEVVLRLSCSGMSREANGIFQSDEVGAMGLIRRSDIASFWKDRLAPWLLGDFAKNENVTLNDVSAISQIKQTMHSCLRSTGKAMHQNWHRMLADRFRNNRT
jgi:hypothetical protein